MILVILFRCGMLNDCTTRREIGDLLQMVNDTVFQLASLPTIGKLLLPDTLICQIDGRAGFIFVYAYPVLLLKHQEAIERQ